MTATTRWKDTINKDFDVVVNRIISNNSIDDNNHRLELKKVFTENQHAVFSNQNIEYNYINYTYTQTVMDTFTSDERTTTKTGFIIPYKCNDAINYIIDQNSTALKFFRKLLDYTNKNELEKNVFDFNDDFFYLVNFSCL